MMKNRNTHKNTYKNTSTNANKGFTLIEMIIAISIFTIIAIAGYSSLSSFVKSSKLIEKSMDNLQELQTFLTFADRDFSQVFNQEIHLSKGVITLTSVQNDRLYYIKYSIDNDKIIREEDKQKLVLLANISKIKFRLLDDKNKWHTTWKKDSKKYIKVVEFTFDSVFGDIKKLVMIDE